MNWKLGTDETRLTKRMHSIMKVAFLFIAVAITSMGKAHESCPKFWLFFKGHCYRYLGERVTWPEAESLCNGFSTSILNNTLSAHLTSIHSEEENRFVYELFRSSVEDYPDWVYQQPRFPPFYGVWLGLHLQNGQWVYTDASQADYFNWKSNEPNNDYMGQPEECVHIFRNNDAADTLKHWNDLLCNEQMSFVCKMPAPPCFLDLTTTSSSPATTDFTDMTEIPSSSPSPTAMLPDSIPDYAALAWVVLVLFVICLIYSFVISILYCKLRRTTGKDERPPTMPTCPRSDRPCTELGGTGDRTATGSQATGYETLTVPYIGSTYATISSPVYENP